MKVVEMVYEVCETSQNGKERILRKKVYSDKMYRFEEGKKALEERGYYKVIMLSADWKDVLFVK